MGPAAALALLLCTPATPTMQSGDQAPLRLTVYVPDRPEQPIRFELQGRFGVADPRLRPAPGVVGFYQPYEALGAYVDLEAWDRRGAALPVEKSPEGFAVSGIPAGLRWSVDPVRSEQDHGPLESLHTRAGCTTLLGYASYLLVPGCGERSYRIDLQLPDGWRAVSALRRDREQDGTVFTAGSFFELVDEPIYCSDQLVSSEDLAAADTPTRAGLFVHRFVEGGLAEGELDRALTAMTRDAQASLASLALPALDRPFHFFFEAQVPKPRTRYGWALEHQHSFQHVDGTNQLVRWSRPNLRSTYQIVHHVMHSWLPRRAFTDRLAPERMLRQESTGAIWFGEGFAQYLSEVAIARAGVYPVDEVLVHLALRFGTPLANNPLPEPRSMTELSEQVCEEGVADYWRNIFSLGALLALEIDRRLAAAESDRDLATVVGAMIERCAVDPGAFPEDRLGEDLSQLCGIDLSGLFASHVHGRDPLPWREILGRLGIEWGADGPRVLPAERISPSQRALRDHLFGPRQKK